MGWLMYNWENGPPGLPKELLSKCYEILMSDDDIEKKHRTVPWRVRRWATDNCKSFVCMEEQDVTDVSLQWDYIYAFYFYDEKDANWFQLKWK